MKVWVIAARICRCALFVLGFGVPQLAQAKETQWVGLFEGHGVVEPKDPVIRRRARVAAQRLSLQCYQYYQVRGGGTGVESAGCRDGELELKRLGPFAAAAILDVLDEPRVCEDVHGAAFPALVRALGNTGRGDLVPIILRALNRISERESVDDPRVKAFGREYVGDLLQALGTLTFVTGLELYALDSSRDPNSSPVFKDFIDWYAAHENESRDQWRQQALQQARRLLTNPSQEVVAMALRRLVEFKESAPAAIAHLKAYVRSPACANWACATERYVLQRLEPKVRWTPPEWTP
jgi:hypothetical protein